MNKAVKIAIIILAPLALAFGLWKACAGPADDAPREFYFADVQTGELVSRGRGDVRSIPMKNPATGDYTFYPVTKNEAGHWVVNERYRDGLNQIEAGKRPKIDMSTYVIQTK